MRRGLRLVLPVAMVASLLLVLPAAGAQSACEVTVSSTNVTVGQQITITGLNFDGGTTARLLADGAVVHQGATSRDGSISTSHSFSTPGTHPVQADGLLGSGPCVDRLQVQVSAATTTTAAPTTTTTAAPTTTTTTEPPFNYQTSSIVSGECLVEFGFGETGHVVSPGQVVGVQGSGFEVGLPVIIALVGYELTVVLPDGDGEFLTTVMVPDWPEATYGLGARQPKSGADWCSGDVEIQIDRDPDPAMGECSISLAQTTVGIGFPWSPVYPVYLTYGSGFVPGEVVVITVEDGYPLLAERVRAGDFTVVEPDGTFVMFDAPPTEWIPPIGTVEVWARSNSCIAKASLGESGPVRADLPSFTVTPEVLKGGGIQLYPGNCELVVWKETGDPVPGVDPAYQNYPLDTAFINAFGSGFAAGEEVTWLHDGQVFTYGSYTTTVDGAGKFYASGGNALIPLQTAGIPFVFTAQTPSCTTSAQYGVVIGPELGDSPVVTSVPLVPVDCEVVAWRGDGQEHSGVPSEHQVPAEDAGHFIAFGTGYTPGGEVTLLLDGGTTGVGDGPPVADGQGNFYATLRTTGGMMYAFDQTPPPFLVTAIDDLGGCSASAIYAPSDIEELAVPVEDAIPIPSPPDDPLGPVEMALLGFLGVGGLAGGFFGGSALASRGWFGSGPDIHPPEPGAQSPDPGHSPPPDHDMPGSQK